MQINIEYPTLDAEREVLIETTGADEQSPERIMSADELKSAQRIVRLVPVGESVMNAILELVRSGRPGASQVPEVNEHLAWGPGPRASQALMLAVRARAVIDGDWRRRWMMSLPWRRPFFVTEWP